MSQRAIANPARAQINCRDTSLPLFRINCDETPLPPQVADPDQDEALLEDSPWVDAPIKLDYGYNVK